MIIQRIAKGIRDQDWFVVSIEIMIVVIGIFLGMQVTDWNEDRKEAEEEQEYIDRLHADLVAQLEQMKLRVSYFEIARADNALVRGWLDDPSTISERPNRLIAAFYNSTVIYPFKPYSTTYQELLSTGKVQLLRDVQLRSQIAQYFYETEPLLAAWNIGDNNPYRLLIRSSLPIEVQDAVVRACEATLGASLLLQSDCSIELDDAVAMDLLEKLRLRPDVLDLATSNLSKLTVALRLYAANEALARDLLRALEKARK